MVGGLYEPVQARVLRPSYAWLLGARPPGRALTRFLQVSEPGGLARLRALPAHRHALARQQVDAEHCLARVLIRTGGRLEQLRGAELLHYADVVRTSGRHRREHLAWEPLVALGVFVGEPPTLRAAWSATGNTRLDTARAAGDGEQFVVDGVRFARCRHTSRYDYLRPSQLWAEIVDSDPGARPVPTEHGRVNITRLEDDGFWAWAIIETLRHTGIRIEELLELTQLSLRHYTPASTNTLVPLLHIVPSKTDTERLVPMSPDLVTALLAVQRRAKAGGVPGRVPGSGAGGAGQVPLSVRLMSFGEARWLLPDGEFTYGEFNLVDITHNGR